MRDETRRAVAARIAATAKNRTRTRTLVAAGEWKKAEENTERAAAYDRRVEMTSGHAEAVHGTNDFQPAAFLSRGAIARRAVGRVSVQTAVESCTGTGFLISPELFITNQHVVKDAAYAAGATVIFDDELDESGAPRRRTVYRLAPATLALFSDEAQLDYAVVALGERLDGIATVEELGHCPISFTPDRHRKGMPVNIVQHPEGLPKQICIRNNLLTDRLDDKLLYETDTDFGSSGSPVFSDQWDVVALHHYGEASGGGAPAARVNEGIRISAIFTDLKQKADALALAQRGLVERALSLWTETQPAGKRLEKRPVDPSAPAEAFRTALQREDLNMATSVGGGQKIIIPLEITVRLGESGQAAISPTPDAAAAPKVLRHGAAEGVKLDTDYTNRNGFQAGFVPGIKLELKDIAAPKKASIAPLHEGETIGAPGELRYQNFSVVMHKTRRIALLTATNIDGATYISIDRKTGEPSKDQPEGETWYRDSRISDSYFVDQEFYSGWSHLFDRGHLTRRNDPTWGDFATRANKDTFHFTNCSPQHWLFNESIKYWQGIERYVLEKGLWETGRDKPVSVLQGPFFDAANDLWADEVQVPSRFWKIVVWKGAKGLRAVALVVDQTKLMSLERKAGSKPPPSDTPVDVSEWRSSIAAIETKTGLDFTAVRPYDTAKDDLPQVGEALVEIGRWEDIPLD